MKRNLVRDLGSIILVSLLFVSCSKRVQQPLDFSTGNSNEPFDPTDIENRLGQLEGWQGEMIPWSDQTDSMLEQHTADIDELFDKLNNLDPDNINLLIQNLTTQITNISTTINNLSGDITSIQNQINNIINVDIAGVKTEIVNIKADISALKVRMTTAETNIQNIFTEINNIKNRLTVLEQGADPQIIANLEARLALVEMKNQYVTVDTSQSSMFITGANLVLRNGMNKTASWNGKGNLILGYNEGNVPRGGSHNVIVGAGHAYQTHSNIISGYGNSVLLPQNASPSDPSNFNLYGGSAILGGTGNSVEGQYASLIGGSANRLTASATGSAACGGNNKSLTNQFDVECGGVDAPPSAPTQQMACATASYNLKKNQKTFFKDANIPSNVKKWDDVVSAISPYMPPGQETGNWYWGMQCRPGWVRTGCYSSTDGVVDSINRFDTDVIGGGTEGGVSYGNLCASDDEEGNTNDTPLTLFITCCKLVN